MPASGTGTFIDSGDYQTSLSHLRIDLLVTSENQGAFNARLTWVTLDDLRLLRCEEDQPRIVYGSLTPTLVFVAFTTRPDPPMLWGGAQLQTGQIIFHSQGERFHQRTTGPCGWGVIGMAPQHLERYGGAISGSTFSVPTGCADPAPPPRGDVARLRRLHAQACRLAETRPKVLAHPEVARGIEQELIYALVTSLAARAQDDGAARRQHTRIMIRFEERCWPNILAGHCTHAWKLRARGSA